MSKTACHMYCSVLLALADEVDKEGTSFQEESFFLPLSVKIQSLLFCQSLFPPSQGTSAALTDFVL